VREQRLSDGLEGLAPLTARLFDARVRLGLAARWNMQSGALANVVPLHPAPEKARARELRGACLDVVG